LTPTVRSSFRKVKSGPADVAHSEWVGKVQAYSSDVTEEDWEQPRTLWKMFKDNGEDEVFLNNLSGHVNKALPQVQKETAGKWSDQVLVVLKLTEFQKCGGTLILRLAIGWRRSWIR